MSADDAPEKTRWGLLIAGVAVTAVVLWFEWSGPAADDVEVVQPARSSSDTDGGSAVERRDFVADLTKRGLDAAINPVVAIDRQLLRDTLDRPLFSSSRRQPVEQPPAPFEPPPPPPPPNPDDLKLIGVMIGREGAVALLRVKGQAQTASVRTGEIIDGWKITRIGPRELDVRKADVSATVRVSSRAPAGGALWNAPNPAMQPNFSGPPVEDTSENLFGEPSQEPDPPVIDTMPDGQDRSER